MFTLRSTSIGAIFFGIFTFQAVLTAAPVRFLPWDDDIASRKIGFDNGKQVAELKDLHPNKRSKTLDGGSGEIPAQLIALDRTSPDGKPVTAAIKIMPGILSPLVLILPDPRQASGLRAFVIEDNSANFGWGTARFINATGKVLLVRQDKTTKTLPESWVPIDFDPGGMARNTSVQLVLRDNLKAILYSAIWEHDPNVRKLALVLPGTDARTGAVEIKIIPEDRRTIPPIATSKAE